MMKKQATLFPESEVSVLAELDLRDAEALANRIKAAVEAYCERIEVVGSIRRQRSKVHDVDFVVVTKGEVEWQKLGQELKRFKAKPGCSGSSVIKAFLPCQGGLFQVDFYRAKPSTFGIHLLVRTGSADHNMWLAGYAFTRGMRLKYSEGLLKDGGAVAGEDERGVFEALGLPCPLPPEREIADGKPVWLSQDQQ